jgi:hypothetical protein
VTDDITFIDLNEFEKPPPVIPPLDRPVGWAELLELEPRLDDLERAVRTIAELYYLSRDFNPEVEFCANGVWYGHGGPKEESLKWQVSRLVGWGRKEVHSILSTPQAYDAATDRLYGLLPDCCNCACM